METLLQLGKILYFVKHRIFQKTSNFKTEKLFARYPFVK